MNNNQFVAFVALFMAFMVMLFAIVRELDKIADNIQCVPATNR